ncbi:hypothetical protein MOBT1_002904 [Malassezia obtusa]|uniref:Uncharacterized protein n=1 Tax=Malassezia obtusa TaxID=76774 RepID=A0AAF0E4C1_9BASI|nr:hypothetical protein MOBT1_002904 [Malassezia obtusa]
MRRRAAWRDAHAAVTEEVLDVHSVADSDEEPRTHTPVHVDLTQLSDGDTDEPPPAPVQPPLETPDRAVGDSRAPHEARSDRGTDARTSSPALDAPESEPEPELDDVDCAPYADEDLELDDVDVDAPSYAQVYEQRTDAAHAPPHAAPSAPLQVVVHSAEAAHTPKRRAAPSWTPRDRKNRVLMHQVHVLALLAAARMRNAWCNDRELRETLLASVPDHLLHKLHAIHPKREPERRERVRLFEAFMHDLVRWWASRFRLHASHSAASAWRQPSQDLVLGRRVPPHTWVDGWVTEAPEERAARHRARRRPRAPLEIALFPPGSAAAPPTYLRLLPSDAPKSAADLVACARARLGTHEASAMLFCALCRALGVPARLVVSVQAAPCTAAAAAKTPHAGGARALRASERVVSSGDEGEAPARPELYVEPLDTRAPPTMWVEAFSKPYQHWITVDPIRALVRVTGSKHMEPPPTSRQNRLVYVVGFEEDGWARDVTARYTRTLHTRVARQRPAGVGRASVADASQEPWWASVVRALHRPQRLDRDAMEDVELADAAAREPMPTSVGAFKDHPVYCLEQFLRREQVVHPPHRVGTFQGRPVYLRANVVQLQSARQWYNQGREVLDGEAPLKTVRARNYTLQSKRMEEQARAEGQDTLHEPLYARAQTRVYVPPPVRDGRVPTNAFGNIDLFVPSMLPAGGTHIAHALAAKAARRLAVHFAEAVVGFEFRKFRSLPRLHGIVVAAEHAPAVWDAIHTAEQEAAASEHARRQARAIKGWRKLLTALTVAKRVEQQYGGVRGSRRAAHAHSHSAPDAAPQLRPRTSPEPQQQLRATSPPAPPPAPPGAPAAPASPPPPAQPPRTPPDDAAHTPAAEPRAIVSLDELIARDELARGAQAHGEQAHSADAAAAAAPAPKRRRIVLRRPRAPDVRAADAAADAAPAADASPAPRRSTRRAARAARDAFQAADSSDDEL